MGYLVTNACTETKRIANQRKEKNVEKSWTQEEVTALYREAQDKQRTFTPPAGIYKDISFPKYCRFHEPTTIDGCTFKEFTHFGSQCKFTGINHLGDHAIIESGCVFSGFVRIGLSCTIRNGISLPEVTTIGKCASFGDNCTVGARSAIGKHSTFGCNAHIGDTSIINDDTIFGTNATFGYDISFGCNIKFGSNPAFEYYHRVKNNKRPYVQIGPLGCNRTITIFDTVSGPMARVSGLDFVPLSQLPKLNHPADKDSLELLSILLTKLTQPNKGA